MDESWHPLRLERQLRFHGDHGLDLSVSAYARFDHATGTAWSWRCPPPCDSLAHQIWQRNPVPVLRSLVRRELIPAGFPVASHEDAQLWLSLVMRMPGLRYGCLPQIIRFYRGHGGNLLAGPPSGGPLGLWRVPLRGGWGRWP